MSVGSHNGHKGHDVMFVSPSCPLSSCSILQVNPTTQMSSVHIFSHLLHAVIGQVFIKCHEAVNNTFWR